MASSLTFTVRRHEPVLVAPVKPTPHESLRLSDIDDQEGLRFQMSMIHFYRSDPSVGGRDPAKVIREALAKALVFYYPFAGRLREIADRKLVVECTGEGVMFIEADADVRLEQFGDALQPPFPCLEELIYDIPGSDGVLGCPLLLIQVTRLQCGGFIIGIQHNHNMSDAPGFGQFLNAVAELARGTAAPSVAPVWEREVLEARDPPRITCVHREYKDVPNTKGTFIPLDDMVHRSFFFGAAEIAVLRQRLPPHQRKSSRFEVLTACLWRCHTIAIRADPEEEVRMICTVNARGKSGLGLPKGYYGNAIAFSVAVSTADKLCRNPLEYALELVKKAKARVTDEYMRSLADLMVLHGRPHFTVVRTFLVSDVTRVGFGDVDFGWGKAAYAGPVRDPLVSYYIPFRNAKGEEGIVVPMCLPAPAMDTFVAEMENFTKGKQSNFIIMSAL